MKNICLRHCDFYEFDQFGMNELSSKQNKIVKAKSLVNTISSENPSFQALPILNPSTITKKFKTKLIVLNDLQSITGVVDVLICSLTIGVDFMEKIINYIVIVFLVVHVSIGRTFCFEIFSPLKIFHISRGMVQDF